MRNPEDVVRLLRSGPKTSKELMEALEVSQPTLSRLFAAAGPLVRRVGHARRASYSAAREVPGLGREIPLFRVGGDGSVAQVAALHPVYESGAVVEWASGRPTQHGGVPWFLYDIRPQGFLGRVFAQAHSDLGLSRLVDWTEDELLRALALRGEDLSGDLILGEVSLQRFYARDASGQALKAGERAARYPQLAQQVLEGVAPGSSAGGEQPKFTARVRDRSGLRSVIVKFSPPRDTSVGRRWADLLVCEHLALEILGANGFQVSASQVIESNSRFFLEVERFDRVGDRGRCGVVSGEVVDAEWVGGSKTWVALAAALARDRRLEQAHAVRVFKLEAFGRLIANTDRHMGNISFFWSGGEAFSLAPVYDMLPMLFAPESGQVVARALGKPTPEGALLPVWEEMLQLARVYWRRVVDSPLVSKSFVRQCAQPALNMLE